MDLLVDFNAAEQGVSGVIVQVQPFGRYRLIERIAVGGMAEVFLARHVGLEGFEKLVVIKRILPRLSAKESFVEMFLNEARLSAQLNHPNIAQIYDLGRHAGAYFIAMEYVFGRDMRRIVAKAESQGIAFPPVYAAKIASQVCEGLYYAHEKTDFSGKPLGIVHRDITPENIVVSFDGTVKLLDFGIAQAATSVDRARAGETKGKLSYMSPEQCSGRALDRRSDIFSLGIALYEWVTGFKLFSGESDVAVLKAIANGKIFPPSYFKREVPAALEAILMKALEKDPADRYQDAWQMQFDIDRFLAGNEFSPSNTHLANFLKQVFADEIDEEQSRVGRHGTPLASEEGAVWPVEPGPVASGAIAFEVRPEQRTALETLATKHGLDVPTLVKEIIGGYLRFR